MADVKGTISLKNAAGGALTSFKTGLLAVGAAAAAVTAAFAGVGLAISKVTRAAAEQEKANVAFAQALATIGQNTKAARDDIAAFNSELQDLTGVDDQAILKTETLLTTFGKLSGEGLKAATAGALDLAAVLGRDVTPIAQVLARAAQGDTASLKQFGITVDETASKGEKWAQVLAQLKQVQGAAASGSQTFSGAMTRISNDFGDLTEAVGFGITNSEVFREVLKTVSDALKTAAKWVTENQDKITRLTEVVLGVTTSIVEFGVKILRVFFYVGQKIQETMAGVFDFIADKIRAVADLVAPLGIDMFDSILEKAESFASGVSDAYQMAADGSEVFREFLKNIDDGIDGLQDRMEGLKGKTRDAAAGIKNVSEEMLRAAESAKYAAERTKEFEDLMGRLGLVTFKSVQEKAKDLSTAFFQLQFDLAHDRVSQEFFDETLKKMRETALELNVLGQEVIGFRNYSAETAKYLLEQLKETAKESKDAVIDLETAFAERFGQEALRQVQAFGDVLVQAIMFGELTFKRFIQSLIAGLIRAQIQALILKAIMSLMGGGGGFGFNIGGGKIGMQHGGEVRGRPGTDTIPALLSPGEIVLPRSLSSEFKAFAMAAREFISERPPSAPGNSAVFNVNIGGGSMTKQAVALLEEINTLVRRRGFTLTASEVL